MIMYCKNVIVIRCSFSLIYFRLYILYVVNECKYVLQYTNKKLLKKKRKKMFVTRTYGCSSMAFNSSQILSLL